MGLIKAALGAAGGVLADQWKEFFRCDAIPADVLATKGRKSAGGRSSNTRGTDNIITNTNLNTIHPSFFAFYKSGKGILKNAIRNTYFGACMAFRHDVLDLALPIPQTNEIGHDIWIGLVAEIVGTVYFIPQPLLLYRRHSQALTNLNNSFLHRSQRSLFVKIWSRCIVLAAVVRFYLSYKVGKFK